MPGPRVADGITLGRLVVPVYLPLLAMGTSVGMLLPTLPLYLRDGGLSYGTTSAVLAAAGVGAMLGALPSGSLLARIGEDRLHVIACGLLAVTAAGLGLTTAAAVLTVLQVLGGAGRVGVRLSRQTLVTRVVAPGRRGRAMSVIGGSFRLALVVGPLLGGALVDAVGFGATFAVAGAVAALGALPVVVPGGALLSAGPSARGRDGSVGARSGLLAVLRRHRRRLLLGGIGPALVMTARQGRYVVVPLIGDRLGLGPAAVGALVAVGTGADLVLFPVSGWLMDRFGRLFAIVPAFGLLAVGLVILGLAGTATVAVVAGVVMGVGNGMSAGTLLTLSSDLAPPEAPGPFLAGMAILQDLGSVAGPLVVGLVADAAGLGNSAFALAGVMVVAVAWIVVVVGETSAPPSPSPAPSPSPSPSSPHPHPKSVG